MEQKPHWRVPALGWGNLVLAVATLIGTLINILAALEVFTATWSQGSIAMAIVFGGTLGYLTGLSGRAVLQRRKNAFKLTCVAGGLTLGYALMGVFLMLTAGIDRTTEILIRHGSDNWWDWSLSHFQHSVLRETPVIAWWILTLGTLIRYPLPGGPQKLGDRIGEGWLLLFCFGLVGALARCIQLAQDTLLSSQR
jgi:hypothetical protein